MAASLRGTRLALTSWLLLTAPATLGQTGPVWVDPPSGADDAATSEPAPPLPFAQPPLQTASETRAQAARDLAYAYLKLWSAPNEVTAASAASFYGPTVTFHGKTRTISSVLAEKRRFAGRWPHRTYRHRPETTQVTCEPDGERCTVRSSFDFDASNSRQSKRARGIGEHELVVSFSSGSPVIEAENSRVVRRGHGNLTWLLRAGVEFAAPADQDDPRTSTGSVRAAPGTSVPELEASSDAVEKCGDTLTAQARRLGSEEVRVSSAGPEVRSPDGGVAVPINARIEYAREGKKQVRQARITCRIDKEGRVVALQ